MGFPRQEYYTRLSFPSLGYLPDSGIELVSPVSLALQKDFLVAEPSQGSLQLGFMKPQTPPGNLLLNGRLLSGLPTPIPAPLHPFCHT